MSSADPAPGQLSKLYQALTSLRAPRFSFITWVRLPGLDAYWPSPFWPCEYSAQRVMKKRIRRRKWEPFRTEDQVTGSQGASNNKGEEKTTSSYRGWPTKLRVGTKGAPRVTESEQEAKQECQGVSKGSNED